jgi:hypothetical protein
MAASPKVVQSLMQFVVTTVPRWQINTPSSSFLVLGLCPGKQHGTEQSERSFMNMLLEDFVMITNLTAVFALNKPDNRPALACMLTHLSLLLLGAEALTTKIIPKVWGQNDMICRNLGGPHGNLDLTRHQLISLVCVANNTFHPWLTTTFNGSMIIPDKALQHHCVKRLVEKKIIRRRSLVVTCTPNSLYRRDSNSRIVM